MVPPGRRRSGWLPAVPIRAVRAASGPVRASRRATAHAQKWFFARRRNWSFRRYHFLRRLVPQEIASMPNRWLRRLSIVHALTIGAAAVALIGNPAATSSLQPTPAGGGDVGRRARFPRAVDRRLHRPPDRADQRGWQTRSPQVVQSVRVAAADARSGASRSAGDRGGDRAVVRSRRHLRRRAHGRPESWTGRAQRPHRPRGAGNGAPGSDHPRARWCRHSTTHGVANPTAYSCPETPRQLRCSRPAMPTPAAIF